MPPAGAGTGGCTDPGAGPAAGGGRRVGAPRRAASRRWQNPRVDRFSRRVLACAAMAALSGPALAEPARLAQFERCAAIRDDAQRLACYDDAASAARSGPPAAGPPVARPEAAAARPSLLAERWAIGSGRDSRFDLLPHKPSYFLAGRFSDAPNRRPSSPSKPPLAEDLDLQATESKFQLSFKVKLADLDLLGGSAIWAGYTQQSHWQVFNNDVSRPFRESDYEPELMLALHPDAELLGWRWRLLVIGFNHQSNGRTEPVSRSWNRMYLQFGLEQGDFALLVRPWWRIPESAADDDNPDIGRYLGYGDIVGVYRHGEHTLSALVRYNVATGHGGLQLAWNFPLARRVRGYVQGFSGYGESLIDYNVRQNTIGVGISLADFL